MLDPGGLQVNTQQTTLRVYHPCSGHLPRLLTPRYALANKLYRGRLPEEFRGLRNGCALSTRIRLLSLGFINRPTRRNPQSLYYEADAPISFVSVCLDRVPVRTGAVPSTGTHATGATTEPPRN